VPPIEPLEESVAALLVHHGITQFEIADRAEVEERPTGKSSSPDRLLVEIERVRSRSIDEILGRLAMRVLMTRQDQRRRLAVPVLVIERLGDKTKRTAREFMSKYAPGHAWGLVDRSGAAALAIPSLKVDIDQPGNSEPRARVRHTSTQLFSDLNQWMLKVLLLVDAPPSLWGGPRQRVATPTELHRVARVSVEKAHLFVRVFEKMGFVRQTRQGLTVVRRQQLLDRWFHAERSQSVLPIPARWIFGMPSGLQDIFAKPGDSEHLAVCGFEACRLLDVLHAPVVQREVYLAGDIESALAAWDLEPCEEHEAHIFLRKARSAQSILRGRVIRANLPVVDVLQAALDVHDQAARGTEQSQYLTRHVLGWTDDE